jgi:hypothetical protein
MTCIVILSDAAPRNAVVSRLPTFDGKNLSPLFSSTKRRHIPEERVTNVHGFGNLKPRDMYGFTAVVLSSVVISFVPHNY